MLRPILSILGVSLLSLVALACSDERDHSQPGSGGTGGDGATGPGGATGNGGSGAGGSGGGPSTGGSGGGGAPVACEDGVPDGAPCAAEDEGDKCDNAGTPCTATCTQGTWVEACVECPDDLPADGTDCATYAYVGPCDYTATCPGGETEAVAECDPATVLWVVTPADCTQP